jgi:hypothetical protein
VLRRARALLEHEQADDERDGGDAEEDDVRDPRGERGCAVRVEQPAVRAGRRRRHEGGDDGGQERGRDATETEHEGSIADYLEPFQIRSA